VKNQTNQDVDYHSRIHKVEQDIERGMDFFSMDSGEVKEVNKDKIKRMTTLR